MVFESRDEVLWEGVNVRTICIFEEGLTLTAGSAGNSLENENASWKCRLESDIW